MRPTLLLRDSVGLDEVLEEIANLLTGLDNNRSGAGSQLRAGHLQWIDTAERTLRSRFEYGAVVDALYTTRFWQLATMENIDAGYSGFNRMMDLENRTQHSYLKRIEDELRTVHRAFLPPPGGELVALDTSFLMHGPWFDNVDWNKLTKASLVRLVVPHVVVDELDNLSHKYTDEKTARRAHKVIRKLRALRGGRESHVPVPVRSGVELQVLVDPRPHDRLAINDAEFVERAAYLNRLVSGRLRVQTNDYGMELRAASDLRK